MLWGAFNNASSAMKVYSTDLGSIGQNIANVNTTGYKRQEMMFSTLMSEHRAAPTSHLSGLNIFGVQATQRNLIEAQGIIAPSTTWSDLAINGKGFFMVASPSAVSTTTSTGSGAAAGSTVPTSIDPTNSGSVMYTRDGAWHRAYGPDTDPNLARNYFLSSQGGYLLGYMADDTGAIAKNAVLEPVYTLAPRPIANNGTDAVDSTSTLKPTLATMPGRATTTAKVLANISRDATMGPSQSQLTVKDAAGNDQTVTLNWTRTGPYSYSVTASAQHATLSNNTWNVTVSDTGKVLTPTTPTTAPSPTFTWDASAGGGTTATSVDLSSPPKRGEMQNIPINVYDNNYTQRSVTLRLERVGTNTWYMMPDGGPDAASNPTPIKLTFDSDGKLTSPAGGTTALSMSWNANAAKGTAAGTATVSVDLSKLTQYSGDDLYIGDTEQDGYARGTLIATTFNEMGELSGYYDNGRSRTLFKVPVANFVADNALEAVSGTMFRRTAEAGELTISGIDETPGEGRFATSSLESSTVDIEDEFTRMIMTQKAYTMNSQVFKTADEMTTVARDIKG